MKLIHLSDQTIHKDLFNLVSQEREILVKLLWHLREVDRRKLYCDHKCGSLFEYAVKVLKYSEGQASRRVTACRLFKELPELAPDIAKGNINLSQLNQAKSFFNDENITDPKIKKEVICRLKGKSIKEGEKLLGELRSVDTPKKISIMLKQETVDFLYKVKEVKAHSCPDLDTLIMKMGSDVMKVWVPLRTPRHGKGSSIMSRYVSVQVKSEVWNRDKGRCQNCGSGYAIEFDHIQPFIRGGKTNTENLQLLCRNCNQRKGSMPLKAVRISRV
ncbi:MAG TPA: HNH endonuclease signature motif containing protein [Bacteriovoracaceae bacterium]|nr:HNH endonuclease signature motif containing protein [Bacteriovoracaceae bacterium]